MPGKIEVDMDISYFHGREVESVLTGASASAIDSGATWAITFVGGGAILGFGDSEPPAVEGLAFMASEVEQATDVAKLYFGTDDNPRGTLVMLRPDEYAYVDDTYSQGVVERPNEEAAVEAPEARTTVAPENIGGTAEGPSEAFLASQEDTPALEGTLMDGLDDD